MNITMQLEQSSAKPMYLQIYRYIAEEVRTGRIVPGDKMPSKRALAAHLGVSLSTVEAAYNALSQEGFIEAKQRSGFYVLPVEQLAPVPSETDIIQPEKEENQALWNPFSLADVDTAVFPYATWAKLLKDVVYNRPELLQRGSRQGDRELTCALREFLHGYRGIVCRPEQIIIGAGIPYLLSMLNDLLPSGCIAFENPGYLTSAGAFEMAGREVLPIPVDENGLCIDKLPSAGLCAVYVTPSHQFPLGFTMPYYRRSRLLAHASRQGFYLIEDDYDSEFRYASRPIGAMQGMAPERVVYIGTFSRTIAPSIRVAYMVLPPELSNLWAGSRYQTACSVSRFEQQALAEFLRGGHYVRHLRRVGLVYRNRAKRLTELLKEFPGVRIQGEQAGLHFVLMHERLTEKELIAKAGIQGIALKGIGDYSFPGTVSPQGVVLGFGGIRDDEIGSALDRLRKAWQI